MINETLSKKIHNMAISCGYDNCGIIPIDEMNMELFEERLEARMKNVPGSDRFYGWMKSFSKIKETFPWAESVVVCISDLTKYRYPETLRGRYAKAYMLSTHTVHGSPVHNDALRFEKFFEDEDIKFIGGEEASPGYHFPLRHAAAQMGMGIIRKNNFFYTENSSFVSLEGYVIDQKCRMVHKATVKPCPEKCTLCRDACMTKSLSDAYTMDPSKCISNLNTFAGGKLPEEITEEMLGEWICGCDACQDICPFNRHDWNEGKEFYGLTDIEELLAPANLIAADDEILIEKIVPKTDRHIRPSRVNILRESAERMLRVADKNIKK